MMPNNPITFSNDPFFTRVEKPWGYEIIWTPKNQPYVGKLLHIHAHARLSLQQHDAKEETWFLIHGKAKVIWDNDTGDLIETELQEGQGYTCVIGQRHRLVGITDCDIVEVSSPEKGTTYRLEDDYAREDETEEMRKTNNRGWKSN